MGTISDPISSNWKPKTSYLIYLGHFEANPEFEIVAIMRILKTVSA
jgi:hypothetical protein